MKTIEQTLRGGRSKKNTPWGYADYEEVIAPGITSYGTPSHGGIHLSLSRYRQLTPELRRFKTFAGGRWYEEDCDWSIVVIGFPQFFSDEMVSHAQEIFDKHIKPKL